MHRHRSGYHGWVRRAAAFATVAALVALGLVFSPTKVDATTPTGWTITTNYTGTAAGTATGLDPSTTNNIVATNDTVGFTWRGVFSTTETQTIVQTLDPGWTWNQGVTSPLVTSTGGAFVSSPVFSNGGRTLTVTFTPTTAGNQYALGPLVATPASSAAGTSYTPSVTITDASSASTTATATAISVVGTTFVTKAVAWSSQPAFESLSGTSGSRRAFTVTIAVPSGTTVGQIASPTLTLPITVHDTWTGAAGLLRSFSVSSAPTGVTLVSSVAAGSSPTGTFVNTIDFTISGATLTVGQSVAITYTLWWPDTALPMTTVSSVSKVGSWGAVTVLDVSTGTATSNMASVAGLSVPGVGVSRWASSATPNNANAPVRTNSNGAQPTGSWDGAGTGTGGVTLATAPGEYVLYSVAGSASTAADGTDATHENVILSLTWSISQQRLIPGQMAATSFTAPFTTGDIRVQQTNNVVVQPSAYTVQYQVAGVWSSSYTDVTKVSGVRAVFNSIWPSTTLVNVDLRMTTVLTPIAASGTTTSVTGLFFSTVAGTDYSKTIASTMLVAVGRFTVTETGTPTSLLSGQTVVYTITPAFLDPIGAEGHLTTTGVSLVDTLDSRVQSYVVNSLNSYWSVVEKDVGSTRTLVFTHTGTVTTGTAVPAIKLTVTVKAIASGSMVNTAQISANGVPAISDNASATVTQQQQLILIQNADAPEVEVTNPTVSWTTTWGNFLTTAQGLASFVDILPVDAVDGGDGTLVFKSVTLAGTATGRTLQYSTSPASSLTDPSSGAGMTWVSVLPSPASKVTAIRVQISALAIGNTGTIQVAMTATGEPAGTIYSNTATGNTASSGALPPAADTVTIVGSTIAGHAFVDSNSNGVQDPGEPNLVGATVSAKDSTPTLIDSAVTNSNGDYLIDRVGSGDYTVSIDASAFSAYYVGTLDPSDAQNDSVGAVTVPYDDALTGADFAGVIAPPLSFNINTGGSSVPATQNVPLGMTATAPADPTKVGYTFTGWFSAAAGGTQWNFATSTMPATAVTLYAQWTVNNYTLSFNLNGATGSAPTNRTVAFGSTAATAPSSPSRTGYTFAHWNTAADDSGTTWLFGTTPMPAADTTLFATWTVNQYTTSFNVNGGTSSAPASQPVNFGATLAAPAVPTRPGYAFTGWFSAASGGTQWDFAIGTQPAGAQTLFAQWSPLPHTVSFDVNGGASTAPIAQTVGTAQLVTIVADPTRTGYTFVQWNTAANGSGTSWVFGSTTMPNTDITLFAQWTVNSYTLTFDLNGGSGTAPTAQSVAFGASAGAPALPIRTGFTFTGWFTAAAGGTGWSFSSTTMPAAATTVFAQWSVNSYTLSFNVNGGSSAAPAAQSVAFGGLAAAPAVPNRTGFTFTGWFTAATGGTQWAFGTTTMPAANTTVFAQWSLNNYTLSFNVNGGSSAAPVDQTIAFSSAAATDPGAATRTGYAFTGWFTAATGGTQWAFGTTTMPAANTTLFAQWSLNSFTLSFNVNGGSGTTPVNQTIAFGGTTATDPGAATRTGYTFTGWFTAATGGTQWAFGATTMPATNTTLFAQWTVNQYATAFTVNGGDSTNPAAQTIDFGTTLATPTAPTRAGYTFTGWFSAATGGTQWTFATDTQPANAQTLFAHWTPLNHTLSFDLNGGSSTTPVSQSVGTDQLATLVADPSRPGYAFTGWLTAATGGTAWTFATTIMPNANVTLFAHWTPVPHTLSFDLNGGAGTAPTAETVGTDQFATAVADPSRTGYVFSGWFTSATAGTGWTFDSSTMPNANVSLFAHWTPVPHTLSFQLNGASGATPANQTVGTDQLATPVSNPTRTGYTFTGWFTAAAGGTTWTFTSTTMPNADVSLFAQWAVNSYQLSFDLNGASGSAPSTRGVAFATLAPNPGDPTRAGFVFSNWNTASDGSGTAWSFTTTPMPANDVALHAIWVLNPHTVTFHVDGGTSGDPADELVAFGSHVAAPTAPIRTGYTFTGWFTAATAGTEWIFAAATMPDADLDLHAQWSINTYPLTFNVNGGESATPTAQTVTYNSTAAAAPTPAPTRTGYAFTGWFTAATAGAAWVFGTSTMPASATTLFAQWSINTYPLTFDVNGGDSVTPTAQTVTYNSTAAIAPTPAPTRTGYTFAVWNSSADGSGTTWAFGTTTMPATGVTLYAQWNIKSYPLSFDLNGGAGTAPADQTVQFASTAAMRPTPDPARTGYTFSGWFTAATGGSAWSFSSTAMPAADTTLHAQWTINSYTLSFDVNDGESAPPDDQTVPYTSTGTTIPSSEPTRTGYAFAGWSTAALGGTPWIFGTTPMPAADTVLYAQWTIKSYTVAFNIVGASVTPASQTVAFAALASDPGDPTRTGYTFTGWNTAATGGTPWDFAVTRVPASDVTLFAQWSVISYALTFDLNGGAGTTPTAQTINFAATATDPGDATRTGYSFTGWSTAASGAIAWDFGTTTMPANDTTLFAQWTINHYALSFGLNGGAGTPPAAQSVVFGTAAAKPTPDPTRTGYTFAGWNTAVDGTGSEWDFATMTMPAAPMGLFAQWTVNQYSLSFDVNGASSSTPAGRRIDFGSTTPDPGDPARAGYTFTGWYTDPNQGSRWVFDATTMPAGDTTLSAHWAVNPYTVNFDLNGSTANAPDTQTIDFSDHLGDPGTPTRTGYTFTTWTTAADGTGTVWNFATMTMPANNITLFAHWTIDSFAVTFTVDGVVLSTQTLHYGDTVTLPRSPNDQLRRFLGWFTGAATPILFDASSPITRDTVVDAGWQLRQIEVPAQSTPGAEITITGSGFESGEAVQLWMHSDPVLLSTVTADVNGKIAVAVTIPTSKEVGGHEIGAIGSVTGTSSAPIQLIGSSKTTFLASTGFDVVTPLVGAALALVVGAGLLTVAGRCRRRDRSAC